MNNYNWKNTFPDTPESFKNRVSVTLNNLPTQKENSKMKNRIMYTKSSFKKKLMIALVATMALGTTAFATGKIVSIVGHSSNIPTYTTLPTMEQVKKDFKFNPKLVEKFDNGYVFTNGYTLNNEALDSQNNSIGKSKELNFTYVKGNDEISLYMENGRLGEKSEKEIIIDTYKDIDLYYISYANKLVPEDYKMTEQDKQDESSGKYVFSYGSKKEEISQFKHLNWIQNGINYYFVAMDSNLSQDELVKMAHQIIDAK